MIGLSFRMLSIKRKLIVTIMGISTLILLSSLSIFMTSELIAMKKSMLEDLSTLADLVGKNSEGALMFLDNKAARENLLALKAKPHIISSYLYNNKGQLFAYYERTAKKAIEVNLPKNIEQRLAQKKQIAFYIDDQIHLIRRIVFAQDKSQLGFVYIKSDREIYWQRISEFIYTVLMMLSFALLMTLILAFRAQKIFTTPIIKLLNSMRYVSQHQDYSVKLKTDHKDELGELINGYNDMLTQLEYHQQLTKNYQWDLEKRVEERTQQLKSARDEALSASRTKSIFLANMSHEIRTPMNAILGYAQLLQQSELNKEQKRKLNIIDKSGNHLLSLINDILELSKIEAGSLKLSNSDFDLLELVQGIENMFKIRCEQKHIKWQMKCFTDSAVCVNGDQGKLRQILINLIGNACKFTDKGRVQFIIEQVAEQQYKFIVKDTGIGIEKDAQTRIFDAFHQEKQGELMGGTGLGLNITRRHIKLLSGDLQLVSAPEQGSEFFFTISLPTVEDAMITTQVNNENMYRLAEGQHLNALVVDDMKDNVDLLSSILKKIGFQVSTAENGKVALEIIAQKCPDLVFMDIRMPVMNGVEAIRHIRKKYSSEQLKCIAVSASGLKHNAQYFIDEGYDLFISKPFRFDAIFQAITDSLGIELQPVGDKIKPFEAVLTGSALNLDAAFIQDLILAAEYGQLTELSHLLKNLDNYGDEGKIIANHLELLISSADLDGIIEYVENLTHEK